MAIRKNTFLLKRSNVTGNVPTAGQILLGELALNTSDVKLYASGTTTNSILQIGWDRVSRTGDTMTGTLYVPTISATTYQNLPKDVFVTGGTYSTGTAIFTNNTGGTFNVTGFASTGDFIPYTGATKDADLGIHQLKADSLAISTASTETVETGEIVWNSIDGTFDMGLIGGVTLQVGQEENIYGKASSAITNGDVVMYNGVQGDHVLFAKADQNVINSNQNKIIGVATQDFIANQFGYVTTIGKVRGLNTLAYSAGTVLYFNSTGSTPGTYTNVEPPAPYDNIIVASVLKSHATQGILMVRPSFRFPLRSVEDVEITNVQNNDIIQYSSSLGYFINTNNPKFTSVSATTMSAVTFTGNLNGLASLATSATTALNSTQLNGQLASFYYPSSNPSGFTSNTGTVTQVNSGNGMNFANFTTSGTITMGTPSSTTLVSTNATTTNSHTHAFAPGGTASQYITGAGTLVTFPTIPTVNDGTLTMATSGIATGSATFTANQAGGSTFTVAVPATDLSIGVSSGTQVRVDSSTGADVNIPVASATLAGIVTTGAQTFAGIKTFTSTISGNINGNAATATNADNIYVTDTPSTNANFYIAFSDTTNAYSRLWSDAARLYYNPSIDTLYASNFNGNATSATNTVNIGVTNNTTTNATYYLTFTSGVSGNQALNVDSSTLTFNPSTNTLTTTNFNGLASLATSATTALNSNSADKIDDINFRNSDQTSPITAPDTLDSNGVGYVTNVNLFGQIDGALFAQAYSSAWQHQIFGDYRTGQLAVRGKNSGTWQSWRNILDSTNFTNYAVPTSRTLTINGTTYDLSANRSWTVSGSGGVTGGGTVNYLAKFTGSTGVGDSLISDNGSMVTVYSPLTVNGDAFINGLTVGLGGGNVSGNSVLGNGALSSNASGSVNIAIGQGSLASSDTSHNLAIGFDSAKYLSNGSHNTIIGHINNLLPDSNQLTSQQYTLSISKDNALSNGYPQIWSPEEIIVKSNSVREILTVNPVVYSGIFIEYVLEDEIGNMRGGTMKGIFNSNMSSIKWDENSTMDIGSTVDYVFDFIDNGAGGLNVSLINNSVSYRVYCNYTSRLILRRT